MHRGLAERDFSSQETTHTILSLPLVSCTYSFTAISLTNSQEVTHDKHTGELELVLQQSILDQYASQHGLSDVNLCQFVSQYTVHQGKVQKQSSPVIVRIFF